MRLWRHKRCAEIQELACFFFQLLDNVTASIGYTSNGNEEACMPLLCYKFTNIFA